MELASAIQTVAPTHHVGKTRQLLKELQTESVQTVTPGTARNASTPCGLIRNTGAVIVLSSSRRGKTTQSSFYQLAINSVVQEWRTVYAKKTFAGWMVAITAQSRAKDARVVPNAEVQHSTYQLRKKGLQWITNPSASRARPRR